MHLNETLSLKTRLGGALAVQHASYLTGFDRQNPVALFPQPTYIYTHNGWMSLVGIECSLPHNPSVLGSIPSCPIFITSTIQR